MAVFDKDAAATHLAWYDSDAGREMLCLQTDLITRLVKPRRMERILDVGCGPGFHLKIFRDMRMTPTGIDPSPAMLETAAGVLGNRAGLFPGRAEELPFDDNDFDVVTLINSLEFTDDPVAALAEAVRVARRQVFVGVINGLSLSHFGWWVKGLLGGLPSGKYRSFTLWELTTLLQETCGAKQLQWGTIGLLPASLMGKTAFIEDAPWCSAVLSDSFWACRPK